MTTEWNVVRQKIKDALDLYEQDKAERPNVQHGVTPREAVEIVLNGVFEEAVAKEVEHAVRGTEERVFKNVKQSLCPHTRDDGYICKQCGKDLRV